MIVLDCIRVAKASIPKSIAATHPAVPEQREQSRRLTQALSRTRWHVSVAIVLSYNYKEAMSRNSFCHTSKPVWRCAASRTGVQASAELLRLPQGLQIPSSNDRPSGHRVHGTSQRTFLTIISLSSSQINCRCAVS